MGATNNKGIACRRCGDEFSPKTIHQHWSVCRRVPLAAELCDMLDRNPALSVRGLSKILQCGYGFLIRRLTGTRWDRDRLRRRGNRAKSLVQQSRPAAGILGPTCQRCNILLSEVDGQVVHRINGGSICHHCHFELGEIAQRLAAGSGYGYQLNRPDREFFRRYDPREMSLI